MKRKTMALLLTGLVALAALAPCALAAVITLPASYTALNLRKGPGTNYAVTGWALDNDEVDILNRGGSWSKVELVKNGKVGYVKNAFIDGLPEEPQDQPSMDSRYDMGVVSGRGVNMRKGPGTGYQCVKTLARGTKLELHDQSGNWYYVRTLSGAKGYISKNYVTLGAPYTTTARVNLRTSPNGALVKTLARGTAVSCLTGSGNWRYVTTRGSYGWVFAKYLK